MSSPAFRMRPTSLRRIGLVGWTRRQAGPKRQSRGRRTIGSHAGRSPTRVELDVGACQHGAEQTIPIFQADVDVSQLV